MRKASFHPPVAAMAERLFTEETHDGTIKADMRIIPAPGVEEEVREIARHLLILWSASRLAGVAATEEVGGSNPVARSSSDPTRL